MKDLYVALIHHPVLDRNRQTVTSSVTNFDLHDIARSCRTFDVKKYFIVHPSPDERALNARIVNHWKTGFGKRAHPTRSEALERLELATTFEEVLTQINEMSGELPLILGTSARAEGDRLMTSAAAIQAREAKPILLVFGTGYGLHEDWAKRLDYFLQPILGPTEYNHLSVRSAVAIYLDRLAARTAITKVPLESRPR